MLHAHTSSSVLCAERDTYLAESLRAKSLKRVSPLRMNTKQVNLIVVLLIKSSSGIRQTVLGQEYGRVSFWKDVTRFENELINDRRRHLNFQHLDVIFMHTHVPFTGAQLKNRSHTNTNVDHFQASLTSSFLAFFVFPASSCANELQ